MTDYDPILSNQRLGEVLLSLSEILREREARAARSGLTAGGPDAYPPIPLGGFGLSRLNESGSSVVREDKGRMPLVLRVSGIIGRDDAVAYPLRHQSISRHHCEVTVDDGRVLVRDLQSRNGIWLNGQRVDRAALSQGDVFHVGTQGFVVFMLGSGGCELRPRALEAPGDTPPSGSTVVPARKKTTGILSAGGLRQVMDELRERLGCEALMIYHASASGAVPLAESAEEKCPYSGMVLQLVNEDQRALWAPRDLEETPENLRGLPEQAIYCAPLHVQEGETIGLYACWREGCQDPIGASGVLSDVSELLGLWAWKESRRAAGKQLLPEGKPRRFSSQLIGNSPAFRKLAENIHRVARTEHPVVLVGPPGCGKTTLAHIIHEESERHDKAFKRLHCAKIPATLVESELLGTRRGAFSGAENREGLLQATHGGTLFVDSLESCPTEVQAKLLDVLEGRSYRVLGSNKEAVADIRWIAAMNEDPVALMKEKRLRQDLWDRLSAQVIYVPSLAERAEDIPILAMHFLEKECEKSADAKPIRGFSPDATRRLQSYAWPGNVRELMNVARRLVTTVKDEVVTDDEVAAVLESNQPGKTSKSAATLFSLPYHEACAAFSKMYVERQLAESGQSVTRAAAKSKLTRRAIYKILKREPS